MRRVRTTLVAMLFTTFGALFIYTIVLLGIHGSNSDVVSYDNTTIVVWLIVVVVMLVLSHAIGCWKDEEGQ